MRRKLYAMMYNVCNLFVLGFDLLYNKVPCQMQMHSFTAPSWSQHGRGGGENTTVHSPTPSQCVSIAAPAADHSGSFHPSTGRSASLL